MNIALSGYGNMGKEVERVVLTARKHTILPIEDIKKADVVIDFTSPEVVLRNIKMAAEAGKNMVVGTTGWYDHLDDVTKIVRKNGIGLIYGQNFSVGANIFFQAVAHATKLASAFGDYDVYGFEIHHTGKKDSPSGTALRTAQEILKNSRTKKVLETGRLDRQRKPDELHFASIRGGRNPGFHEVVFDSGADSITLSHSAHNRSGFAEGAVLAAEFIHGKKGLYTFDDVMKINNNV